MSNCGISCWMIGMSCPRKGSCRSSSRCSRSYYMSLDVLLKIHALSSSRSTRPTQQWVGKISRTRPHVQDVWNISKYSLGSRLSASFPVFLPCRTIRLSHRRSFIEWPLHGVHPQSRTLPASSALTCPSSSSSRPRPSSEQRPSRQMPAQRGVVRSRPCRDPETGQHESLSLCASCAGLNVQSLPEVTRSRLLRGRDRARCRRRGSGRTAFPEYPEERDFLYALVSVFNHPLLCVFHAHCHTKLIPAS
jgi:hypothetical protein